VLSSTVRPAAESRRLAAVALVLAAALVLGFTTTAVAEPPSPTPSDATTAVPSVDAVPGRYIVTLADEPAASYDGGVAGYAATKPAKGRKVSLDSARTERYRSFLKHKQATIARSVGARTDEQFSVALNGFVADLDSAQAQKLQVSPGVVSVVKDQRIRVPDNRKSTDFLKLSGPHGVWSDLGGPSRAGQGVVVGVIDSGIWPESASFAGDRLGHRPPDSPKTRYRPYRDGYSIVMDKSDGSQFRGVCQTGPGWSAQDCTTKIVGARYFDDNISASLGPNDKLDDYLSPRDGGGHGTNTASTAAGNHDVRAVIDDHDYGPISGVAPAAKIAVYKVLWQLAGHPEVTGTISDIVEGIDAAVGDGVDVINYSIAANAISAVNDPVSIALFNAAAAGIFVAAAAGNSGPSPASVNNAFPWVTTVAASTVQPWQGTIKLGNGARYAGTSTTVTRAVGPASLVNATAVGRPGADPAGVRICAPGTLDPDRVRGTIVVCDRGVIERVAKSSEVQRAGGIGMILVNLTTNTLDDDQHGVPTVHINPPASQAVQAYAGRPDAEATLVPGNRTDTTTPYPQVAAFSSRGPAAATGGDVLKPDLAAPGVSILGAVAPRSSGGQDFGFESGTSVAAPHVAGLAALFLGDRVHPTWSPMRIKSAMMTTAGDTVTPNGRPDTDPYAQGAGQVRPQRMLDPGLVYDSGPADWLAFVEGLGFDTGSGVAAKDPSELNMPSIAVGALVGRQRVTRTVTAVRPGKYRVRASIPGMKVKVSPSVLTVRRAGERRRFTVTLTRTTAPLGETTHGFLTWRSGRESARIPLVAVPRAVSAPAEVSGDGASGSVRFVIRPGVSGVFPIRAYGLASGPTRPGQVTATTSQVFQSVVPSGSKLVRFAVDADQPAADIDLGVYRLVNGQPVLVGVSGSPGGQEQVTLASPSPGTYLVQVRGFADPPGSSSTTFVERTTVVSSDQAFGFTVTPSDPRVRAGRPRSLTARWSGAVPTTPYLGWVEYPDGTGTVVSVN
jgi:subtilisin family serine protease